MNKKVIIWSSVVVIILLISGYFILQTRKDDSKLDIPILEESSKEPENSIIEEANKSENNIQKIDDNNDKTEINLKETAISNDTEYINNTPTELDSDGDGLSDEDELYVYFTHPSDKDTDGDSFTDKQEIDGGYDPLINQSLTTNNQGKINNYLIEPLTISVNNSPSWEVNEVSPTWIHFQDPNSNKLIIIFKYPPNDYWNRSGPISDFINYSEAQKEAHDISAVNISKEWNANGLFFIKRIVDFPNSREITYYLQTKNGTLVQISMRDNIDEDSSTEYVEHNHSVEFENFFNSINYIDSQ